MNELRVDIGGSVRGFQKAADEAVGIAKSAAMQMEERQKKADIQASDNYVNFWQSALEKRDAADLASHEKRMAQFNSELESYTLTQQEMAHGSGGYGWRTDATAMRAKGEGEFAGGRSGFGRGVGMMAGQAAMTAAGGGGWGEVKSGALMIGGGLGVEKFVTHLMEGKVEGLRRLPGEIMHVLKGFAEWGSIIARGAGILAAVVGVFEIAKAAIGMGRGADQSNASGANLRSQDASLGTKLGLGANATHEQIIAKQRQLMALQDESIKKDDQAAAHKATLATLAKYEHDEMEGKVNAQTRLAMLMGDERDLKAEIAAAEKEHNEASFLSASESLIRKNAEIKQTIAELKKESEKKPKHAANTRQSEHVDSMSSAGLFSSAGAVTQPMIDIQRQQLSELQGIRAAVNKPSIFEQ